MATTLTPGWLSITAYSRHYGADRKTVHKWLAAGLLNSYRVGRFIRVENTRPKPSAIQSLSSGKVGRSNPN